MHSIFSLRMAFHMFINMIITGLENPQAVAVSAPGNVSFLIIKRSAFSRRKKKCANCKLFWIGQLLIVSWIGGPSHFECQPYWLYLITPHSMFVYGGNESLTNHGIPPGGRRAARAADVMTPRLRGRGLLFANFVSRYIKCYEAEADTGLLDRMVSLHHSIFSFPAITCFLAAKSLQPICWLCEGVGLSTRWG